MSDRDPPTVPLYDTWTQGFGDAAWYPTLTPPPSLEAGDVNEWMARLVERSFAALGDLVRPWRIAFNCGEDERAPFESHLWTPGQAPAELVAETARAIRALAPWAVRACYADLDLFAFARTAASPRQPARVWLRLYNELAFRAPSSEAPAGGWLTFSHGLALPTNVHGDDNGELHRLNQPLIERALRSWEAAVGPIESWEGSRCVTRYGYADAP